MTKLKKVVFGLTVFLGAFFTTKHFQNKTETTDLTKNAVMIVNKAMNHGGTGVILESSSKGSLVLTNDNVCRAVKEGGVIRSTTGDYQVQSMLESQVSDLCLTYTPADLKCRTTLAATPPKTFSTAKVSGHPGLLATIITTGHFSEKSIIQVFTGLKACTQEDLENPETAMICMFFGGIPVIKSYESQLVSATIMPGSSGSGVYNAKNELEGVVFAGQGDFGYGFIVPYDQIVQFLSSEIFKGQWYTIDQTVSFKSTSGEKKNLNEVLKKCNTATDPKIVGFCDVLKRDVTWSK